MLFLSLAGLPPLAGFFAKFYVFLAAIQAGLVVPAMLGVLASAIGLVYYLRLVKVMYFDEPAAAFDRDIGAGLAGDPGVCPARWRCCSSSPPRRCITAADAAAKALLP